MEFKDPFESDTQRFRDLINKDSKSSQAAEYQDAEVIDSEELLDKSTIRGLPPSAFQAVNESIKKLNTNKEKKNQVAKVFNQLFSDLNTKYGLDVRVDFDSFTENMTYSINPITRRAREYYLSEAYGVFRVVLYQQYLQAIAMLSAQILDPAYLLSESMTYADKLDTMQKLYEFMRTMNDIYKEVNIPDTDMKLEKLTNNGSMTGKNLNDPKIREYMDSVFNNIKLKHNS